jgi:hypothetical protein
MADIVTEIQCNSAQEKFLIMLLERVEKLEDALKQSNNHMTQLLSLTTSNFFSVNLTGQLDRVTKNYTDISTMMDKIKQTIHDAIPCQQIYGTYYHDNTGCSLILETKDKYLLETVASMLSPQLRKYVHMNSWTMKHHYNIDLSDLSAYKIL